jgi:hypothetical protein
MTSMDFWIPNSDKLIITQPLLGRGFKLSEEGFRDYVWTDLKEENHFKSDHITTAGHYTLSKDASSLLEALNVSGSASLQFKIFTGEAAGQFTVDNTSSSNVVVVKFKSEKVSPLPPTHLTVHSTINTRTRTHHENMRSTHVDRSPIYMRLMDGHLKMLTLLHTF